MSGESYGRSMSDDAPIIAPISWTELRDAVVAGGGGLFLATADAAGRPHVAFVSAGWGDERLWTSSFASSRKVANLRILRGERSAVDEAAGVLLISQFTLYADTAKGRRPSWNGAAPGPVAEPLVIATAEALRGHGLTVSTGTFGAEMAVELVNDGPMTLLLEA